MTSWKILAIICIAAVSAESTWYQHHKREIVSNICDPVQNNTNKVQCFCGKISRKPLVVINADCYQTVSNVSRDDPSWEGFISLQNATKLTLTNTRGVAMTYIPTNALKHTKTVLRLDVKYCNIEKIEAFAFANLSLVKEISLRDNQVKILAPHAFAHHLNLKTISLDQNNIAEINRDVFVDLPSLQQLFLTGNKLTTIHDRAFIHLSNLKELEIDKNNIFSLNSETFSGLRNLEKLELSSNSLEVIGDNTFIPLVNLRFLNLGENKIQMLDEKAFNGLSNLQFLSLPSNKLTAIENEKVFEPLIGLSSLSLKDNEISVIKPEAITPLLNQFYNTSSQLILEGNHLLCDCNLDVFQPIMNKTRNGRLRLEILNLQCYPSEEVKQKWDNFQEIEKTSGHVFEDEELQESSAYEYYDDAELNGTLFYFDVRHLLNCSGDATPRVDIVSTTPSNVHTNYTQNDTLTKVTSSPVHLVSTTPEPIKRNHTKVSSSGVLDLSISESITSEAPVTEKKTLKFDSRNEIMQERPILKDEKRKEKKDNAYTTSRLATVSAKPVDQKGFYDHDMASDEAKPDRITPHRSIQEEVKDMPKHKSNNAHRKLPIEPLFILMILCFRVIL